MPKSMKTHHRSCPRPTVLFVLLLVLCVSAAIAGPTVILKERAVVEGTVTLGDIAEIEGDEGTGIADVTVGNSPLAGRSRTVSAGYVRMRMARVDFEDFVMKGADQVELVGRGVRKSSTRTRRQPTQQSGDNAVEPPPPVIYRSQRVQVTLINHGVIISAAGRAMADAAFNAPVPVRISSTGQQIQGTAAQQGHVIVRLGGRPR